MIDHQPDLDKLGRLWATVSSFIIRHEIGSDEVIRQTDAYELELTDLIVDLCEQVGYYDGPDDDISLLEDSQAPEESTAQPSPLAATHNGDGGC